jgi:outer membrane protein OmpA-like peptidoglycan-associated protein
VKTTKYIAIPLSVVLFIGCGDDTVPTPNDKKVSNIQKSDKSKKIQQLITQRDEAIKVALHIGQDAQKLESQNLALNAKMKDIIKTSSPSSQIKVKTSPKSSQAIKNLKNSRDEAINVSLHIEEENRKLKTKISQLSRYNKEEKQYYQSKIDSLKQISKSQQKKIIHLSKNLNEEKKLLKRYKYQNIDLTYKIREFQNDNKYEVKSLQKSLTFAQKQLQKREKSIDILQEKLDISRDKTYQALKEKNSAIKIALNINKSSIFSNSKIDKLTKQRDEAIQTVLNISRSTKDLSQINELQKVVQNKDFIIDDLNTKLQKEVNLRKKAETKLTIMIESNIENIPIPLDESLNLSNLEFQLDSATLTPKSNQLLDNIVNVIKQYPNYKYHIQGHTDSSGNEQYNLNLSLQRAQSVNDYLLSKGIDNNILSFEGYGSSKPIADNHSQNGRIKNRRVVVEVK